MMKTYPMPVNFSGAKFAKRYGLDSLKMDFWADEHFLYVPDTLPDDPPIFETTDPPKPAVATRLDSAKTLPDLIAVLKDVLK